MFAHDQRSSRVTSALWLAAAVTVFWSFGYTTMRGSDLWWHIAGGQWMVENRTFFVPEPFAFTAADTWWLNDAWLSDVIFHLWVVAFGIESLAYWKWLVLVVTWCLLWRVVSRLSGDRTCAFVATTIGLAVAAPFLDVRPQLYSFLCFVFVLDACVGRRPPLWLPLVFLVWANLHAGFVLGLAILPVALIPAWRAEPQRWRVLLLLALACVCACALNPNGVEVLVRPLRYAFDASSPFRSLGEWRPPFEPGGIQSPWFPYGIGLFAAATLAGLGERVFRKGQPQLEFWVAVAIAGFILVLALRSRRIVPFFAIAQALVVGMALARIARPAVQRIPPLVPPLVAMALGLYWLLPMPQRAYAFDYLTAHYEFPIESVNFIEHNQLSGRMFNYYNWGGYVNMRTHGRMQIFIDGRADTVFSDQTYLDYIRVLHQQPDWRRVIDASQAEWLLWPTETAQVVRQLLQSGEWDLIYQDYVSALLRRADAAPLGEMQPTPDSPYRRLISGWRALHMSEFRTAEAEFQRALEMLPHLPHACWNLARVRVHLGEYDSAQATARRCDDVFPGTGQMAWFDHFLAQAHQRKGAGG